MDSSFFGRKTTPLLASYGRERACAIVTQSAQPMTDRLRHKLKEYREFKQDDASSTMAHVLVMTGLYVSDLLFSVQSGAEMAGRSWPTSDESSAMTADWSIHMILPVKLIDIAGSVLVKLAGLAMRDSAFHTIMN